MQLPRLNFIVCLVFLASTARGQDAGTPGFFEERKFLFEVKQIDEFFERFNDEKKSFLRQNIGRYYPNVTIDRIALLNTLFDNTRVGSGSLYKKQFVQAVSQHQPPYFLNFYDQGWYAEVGCVFLSSQRSISATVILRIDSDSTGGSRWVISAIRPDRIPRRPGKPVLQARMSTVHFLSPMSHTTNFSGLYRAFEDRENMGCYIGSELTTDTVSVAFLQEFLTQKSIRFEYVKSVQYFFSQVPGWRFVVSACAKEKSINTGWLITELVRSERTENRKKKVVSNQSGRL